MEGTSLIDPTARFTYYDSLDKLGFIVEAVTRSKEFRSYHDGKII